MHYLAQDHAEWPFTTLGLCPPASAPSLLLHLPFMEPGANTRAETYERQREIVRSVLEAKPPTCTLGEAARLFEAAVGPDFFEASLRILVPLLESPTSARSFQGSVPDQLAASNVSVSLEWECSGLFWRGRLRRPQRTGKYNGKTLALTFPSRQMTDSLVQHRRMQLISLRHTTTMRSTR